MSWKQLREVGCFIREIIFEMDLYSNQDWWKNVISFLQKINYYSKEFGDWNSDKDSSFNFMGRYKYM